MYEMATRFKCGTKSRIVMSEPDRYEDPVTGTRSDTTPGAEEPVRRPFPVAPTSTEYTHGFETIRGRLSDQQVALLREHYHSEGYRASVHDLAHRCGIKSWRTVNRQYGEIAKLVLTAMGYDRPKGENVSLWFSGLVVGFDNMDMVLRPQVVRALVKSGIVEADVNEPQPNKGSVTSSKDVPDIRTLKGVKGLKGSTIPNNSPTVDEMVHAFERIREKITRDQVAMLVLNHAAGDRGVTMWELSQVCAYRTIDPKYGCSVYNDLAEMVYKELGHSKTEFEALKGSYLDLVLAREEPSEGEMVGNYGVVFVMRPEVAEALERLKIVDTIESVSYGEVFSTKGAPRRDESAHTGVVAEEDPGDAHFTSLEDTVSNYSRPESNIQENRTSVADRIKVHFIRSRRFPFLNRLGMTFAPGVVDLTEESGLKRLDLGNLADGEVIVLRFQAPADASVPESISHVISIASEFEKKLRRGATVIVHCEENPEMATLAAACLAVAASDAQLSAMNAIELVREAHPGAIDIDAQAQFVAEFEKEWLEVMAKRGDHYLLYWQERSVLDHAANDTPLDVVASNGLFGAKAGDTLWIVTLTQEREFLLAGRLVVGEIVEYEEAIRRMPDAGLWQAEYYAFPEPETEEFMRLVPLTEIAEELRFDGENDRLTVVDGQINPQQLRKRRKLAPESAELVASIWEESAPITDPDALVMIWQQMAEEHPDDPDARYNFGVALGNVGREEDAAGEFEATIRLDPNYFSALYNLGNHFVHMRQFDKAIEMYNRAILVDGDFAPAHFMLGVAYFESGRFDDAVLATRQGLEVDPDDSTAYYNIAYWTFQEGDLQRALELAEEVLERDPKRTDAAVLKGRCYRELGELDNEIDAYKEALEFGIDLNALFFLGAAWERKITGTAEGIEYVESYGEIDLNDPIHQFCYIMGNLAWGERDSLEIVLDGLRSEAPHLAERVDFALRVEPN